MPISTFIQTQSQPQQTQLTAVCVHPSLELTTSQPLALKAADIHSEPWRHAADAVFLTL